GSEGEFTHAIECDPMGFLYLSGGTLSPDHPCTAGAYCRTYHPGGHDLFLTRFTPDLTALSASTFIGAGNSEVGYRLLLNAFNELYLTGPTESPDFHVTPGAYDLTHNGGDNDAYVMRFALTGIYADKSTLSEQGGIVDINVVAGTENANRLYLLLGSLSGVFPGFPLPGGHAVLPIHWDAFTDAALMWVNSSLFTGFMETLDEYGNGSARINSGPIVPGFTGAILSFAGCLNSPFDVATNPMEIEIVP
ncbi:MAG: hypothetical protein ABIK28_24680, partial [Planctomycetota bacterium]